MKILTVCSGIGSPEVAMKRVFGTISIVASCEIDKFANKTYLANFDIDQKHYHKDITTFDATQYEKENVGIFIGGFPCQAFSVTGKRLGFEDTRGTIFYDCVRITMEHKPQCFIFENVEGLVSHDKPKEKIIEFTEKDLFDEDVVRKKIVKAQKIYSLINKGVEIGRTLKVMEDVLNETGYFWTWKILNTKDYGVPQNRKRIFMVGFKNKEDYLAFKFPKKQKLTKRLKDYLDDDVSESFYLTNKQIGNALKSTYTTARDKFYDARGTVGALCASDYKNPKCVVVSRVNLAKYDQLNRVYSTDGISPCIDTMQGGHREPKVKIGDKVRKLTPRECMRLQGFPDEFKTPCSNSQTYKQAGNSMTVDVMEAIARSIKIAFQREKINSEKLGGLFATK